jgi:serine/threonine-protein kinase ULK/ATG1
MEFCKDGDLDGLIRRKRPNEKECLYYFSQLVSAFKYLRSKQMLHRDIKPENILVHNDVLKLSDFGFSKNIIDGEK